MAEASDFPLRLEVFSWLREQVAIHGEVLPWTMLSRGVAREGLRIPLVAMQGIFTPKAFELPLTIRSAVGGPYDDAVDPSGYLRYRYRGTDPFHRDNVGLRGLMKARIPLVYLKGVSKGQYQVIWPVFIVGDSPGTLTFTVAADEEAAVANDSGSVAYEDPEIRRRYVTATVRRRLHQEAFRSRVLDAYQVRCALCRLGHRALLDAAHIVPDSDEQGEPRVPNGLALCKLHHAAFDGLFLTVDPDYRVLIRRALLEEKDGPMLKHGLQELHGQKITVPKREDLRPDRNLLADRLVLFEAG